MKDFNKDEYAEQVKSFQNCFINSTPTDSIEIDHTSAQDLKALWLKPLQKHKKDIIGIPSDLFFNNTIPILDMNIVSGLFTARIKINEDYKTISKVADDWTYVGLIRVEALNMYGFYPLGIKKGNDTVREYTSNHLVDKSLNIFDDDDFKTPEGEPSFSSNFDKVMEHFIDVWYGIQIALLHPVVKTIFEKPRMERIPYKNRSKAQHGKSAIKYVKKHYIKPDELEKLIYGSNNGKSYHRHALIWHVIGHWREYKNGHKVFIQPYWKGALKDSAEKTTVKRKIIINEQEIK